MKIKWAYWLVVPALALVLAGCASINPFASNADNTITTTTTRDGVTTTKEEKLSDASLWVRGQVEAILAQKPAMEMEAKEGESIEIKGLKTWRVYATNGQPKLDRYMSAFERIFINGLPLIAMVAQGYINADMAVKIVDSVGALAGNKTYNIATQDGSPVQISGSSITNGAVTVTKSPTTTTTTTGAEATP